MKLIVKDIKMEKKEELEMLKNNYKNLVNTIKEIQLEISNTSVKINSIEKQLKDEFEISLMASNKIKCTSIENFRIMFKDLFITHKGTNFNEIYNPTMDFMFLLDDNKYLDLVILSLGNENIEILLGHYYREFNTNKVINNRDHLLNIMKNIYKKMTNKKIMKYISDTYFDGKKIKLTYSV